MENALVVRQELTPQTWDMIQAIAPAMHTARYFGVLNPEQGMAIMLKGHELGLGLAASFEYIKPIQGRPALVPMGALALIQGSGLLAHLEVEDVRDPQGQPQECRVTMERKDSGFRYTATFSMDDAKRAKLVKDGSGWEKYPANMLRWRAIGFCADIVCPDVLGGMKRADELGADLTPSGDAINGAWTEAGLTEAAGEEPPEAPAETLPPVVPQSTPEAAVAQVITLDDLLAKYKPDQIMTANDGKIPATLAEVAAVAKVLADG